MGPLLGSIEQATAPALHLSVQQAAEEDQHPIDIAGQVLGNPYLVKSVFQCLSVQDLCGSAAVCKLWRQISDSNDFWAHVSFERKCISGAQV